MRLSDNSRVDENDLVEPDSLLRHRRSDRIVHRQSPDQPNFIIYADDLSYGDLWMYGVKDYDTPVFDCVTNDCMISICDTNALLKRGGVVDESGSFELIEVPFGEYKVRVVQTPSNLDVNVVDERIPKKYSRVETSGLSASITSTEPVTLEIEME